MVLTVWETAAAVVARSAPFAPLAVGDDAETEADAIEAKQATVAALEGAKRGREAGWKMSDRVERSENGAAATIMGVAEELDARLIVCGRRGRSPVRAALLGSVSNALVSQARRPVLVAPEG